ncbi:sefir domain protein [Bdellovibrio bacteriovorus W]|nr:sefir domain protein [Bdellovibrio bacteriovorus W]
MSSKPTEPSISAFISYSWDSDPHVEWVNSLAHILRGNSIKSLTDQICVGPGASLNNFMRFGVDNSSWKICVISDGYVSKMNDLKTGVGKEIEMLERHMESEYIIPILKNNSGKGVPDFFEGKFWIDFDGGEYLDCIQKLVKRILGFNKMIEPMIGLNPYSKEVSNVRMLESDIKKLRF